MEHDVETIKKALLEILGESENIGKGKKFFFPKNVEQGYNLIPGLTIKDAVKYVLPAGVVSVILAAIPPYNSVAFWIIKFILIMLILCTSFCIVLLKPVRGRSNIKVMDYIKNWYGFITRQKIYYIKPKRKEFK